MKIDINTASPSIEHALLHQLIQDGSLPLATIREILFDNRFDLTTRKLAMIALVDITVPFDLQDEYIYWAMGRDGTEPAELPF